MNATERTRRERSSWLTWLLGVVAASAAALALPLAAWTVQGSVDIPQQRWALRPCSSGR